MVYTNGSAEVDVVVVGAGFAGFTAAVEGVELGLETMLLDRTTTEPSWSNSRLSGGVIHACHMSLSTPPGDLVRDLQEQTGGAGRRELAGTFAHEAGAIPSWLALHGIPLTKATPEPYQDFVLAPPAQTGNVHRWEGRGPEQALDRLKAIFVSKAGVFRSGHHVQELMTRAGQVIGVVANTDRGPVSISARAVVLADGGFQANRVMLEQHIAPAGAARIVLRGANTGTGDGIRMGAAVGAQLVNMNSFYGHTLSLDALHNDRLRLYPTLDRLTNASVLISRLTSQRFIDEGRRGITIANMLARGADPQHAVIVCDSAIWHSPAATSKTLPANPSVRAAGGTVWTGSTIAELAEQANLDALQLQSALDQYNQAVADRAQTLPIPRTGSAQPIAQPPFFALPIVPGITHTMGGLLINADGQVLDSQEQPIAGLWAAGATAGGLDGGPDAGYAGGLAPGFVFGKRAARSIHALLAQVTYA